MALFVQTAGFPFVCRIHQEQLYDCLIEELSLIPFIVCQRLWGDLIPIETTTNTSIVELRANMYRHKHLHIHFGVPGPYFENY
jgi:hypothetical protein